MADELRAAFDSPSPRPAWSDREAVIDYMVEADRLFAGPAAFDAAAQRRLAGRIFDRTENIQASLTNHWILDAASRSDRSWAG